MLTCFLVEILDVCAELGDFRLGFLKLLFPLLEFLQFSVHLFRMFGILEVSQIHPFFVQNFHLSFF